MLEGLSNGGYIGVGTKAEQEQTASVDSRGGDMPTSGRVD